MSAYDAGLDELLESADTDVPLWIARVLALSISLQIRCILSEGAYLPWLRGSLLLSSPNG